MDPVRGKEEAHGPLLLVALISPGISSHVPLDYVLSHSLASYSHPFIFFKKDLFIRNNEKSVMAELTKYY